VTRISKFLCRLADMKRSTLLPVSVAVETLLILLLFAVFFMLFRVEIPVTGDLRPPNTVYSTDLDQDKRPSPDKYDRSGKQPSLQKSEIPTVSPQESPSLTDQPRVKTITLYNYLLERFKKGQFAG
jgi:hypothetical protein